MVKTIKKEKKSRMPMPRKCNTCKRTYMNNFNAHARGCPNFDSWQFLDRSFQSMRYEGK